MKNNINKKGRKIELFDYVWVKEDTMEEAIPPRFIPKHTAGYLIDFVTSFNGKDGCFIEVSEDFDGKDDPVIALGLDQIELVAKSTESCAFFILDHKECQTYEKVKEMYDSDAEEVWKLFNEFKEKGITWDKVMSGEVDLSKR